MTPDQLIDTAQRHGLQLHVRGQRLTVSPASLCSPDLLEELRANKEQLLRILAGERSDYTNAAPPHALALRPIRRIPPASVREGVIRHILTRIEAGNAELGEWFDARMDRYHAGLGHAWDCGLICYAAARDALMWLMRCQEHDLWALRDEEQ